MAQFVSDFLLPTFAEHFLVGLGTVKELRNVKFLLQEPVVLRVSGFALKLTAPVQHAYDLLGRGLGELESDLGEQICLGQGLV